ncbi:D-alanyl-D-alanine carboxypeptidase [Schnuerera sp. xch1]|uniref:D-alanyl-D-alanine carboxypeptidase family protein n=1 Tax=Schnuerera sp. xch1 TaxID=2874283 RepID=UPI001CBD8CE9|nr:D-alanyl-D-alanine carboxypeptidase family protein [Schnuerera sp. xch1]MBZ2175363.1 D-alanyl-D-alanine carboxypeptidase [Schnuerera sp. xch1]
MKKIISIVFFLIFVTYSVSFADSLNLSCKSAILIDANTGQVLYEKNPHLKLHPASTTKIMTGILAIEHGNMNDIVTVDEETVYLTEGSHIALEPEEQLPLEDLLHALLIESANDSAFAIAKYISGSTDEFAKLMNNKAKELGALNTNFVNPNGLTNENHLTTAYDLSLMAKYAMENETFREIVSNYTYTIPVTNKKDEERYLKSSNKLLYSNETINVDGEIVPIKYDGITGIKTGYTQAAQNCLVASAKRGNQNLIAVVLKVNGKEIYSDMHKLLNYGFDNFDTIDIAVKNEFVDNLEIKNGEIPIIAGIVKKDLPISIPKDSINKVTEKVMLDDELKAPIENGQTLGKIKYYLEDQLVGEVDIVSTLDVDTISSPTIFEKILNKWYLLLIGFFIIVRAIVVIKQKKKRKHRRKIYRVPSSYR